jgi:hypothetical protein
MFNSTPEEFNISVTNTKVLRVKKEVKKSETGIKNILCL